MYKIYKEVWEELTERDGPFSVKKIWDDLIIEKKITGEVFEETFYHTTDFQIYNKLKKMNIIF